MGRPPLRKSGLTLERRSRPTYFRGFVPPSREELADDVVRQVIHYIRETGDALTLDDVAAAIRRVTGDKAARRD
jgi:hypothetical protein